MEEKQLRGLKAGLVYESDAQIFNLVSGRAPRTMGDGGGRKKVGGRLEHGRALERRLPPGANTR
jgi:hypothetical protein